MPHTLQGFKAELFKALAHPARIKVLEHLRSGERTVSELQALLDIESSTVSQQLAILRQLEAGEIDIEEATRRLEAIG